MIYIEFKGARNKTRNSTLKFTPSAAFINKGTQRFKRTLYRSIVLNHKK